MDVSTEPRASGLAPANPSAVERGGRAPAAQDWSGPAPPLSFGQQMSYGVGSAAFGIGGVSLGANILLLYFNQVIGLPAVWVGAAIMISTVVDAFTDPLIGLYSDRLRALFGI